MINYINYKNCPAVGDIVGFELETTDDDGVFVQPESLNKVTIYYIEKSKDNTRVLEQKIYNHQIENEYNSENANIKDIKKVMEDTAVVQKIPYSNSKIVMDTRSPIWTADGKVKSILNLTDKNNNPINGKFLFIWKPVDMRPGTYAIRWDWKLDSNKLRSNTKIFTLTADISKINSIYSKLPPRDKYNFLMDKYIPRMYRTQTSDQDFTPQVLVKFNKAVAQGLLEIEDMAVQVPDGLDPMFAHEQFLPLLANFFNLELKSKSVGSWRNQIKHAMHLYKKKGTVEGLSESLDKIGVKFLKLTNLWQVVSPYSWTESFVIEKDDVIGLLTKNPINADIKVEIRSSESDEYVTLPDDIVTLHSTNNPELRTMVVWNGHNLNPEIRLFKGDILKIKYYYKEVPENNKSIESYLESLPLADCRDESKFKYPLKNWNIKLIEEDDPLFDLLVPERNPFCNPVTYGKIRTTFLYSEKVYNMDTYNGSLFNSPNPCDMDKDFFDSCTGGQSSKFNIYLEVDKLDNDIVKDIKDVIIDYSPFHAILHNLKLSVRTTEMILPPDERIKNKINKKSDGKTIDKISMGESVYCKITYRDGTVQEGKVI